MDFVLGSHVLIKSRLLVADENVDMPANPASIVEDPALEVGVPAFQAEQAFRDGPAGGLDANPILGALPKRSRQDDYRHDSGL